ncbi:hypothetical protein ACFE04_001468 [Oxalis oulophora]
MAADKEKFVWKKKIEHDVSQGVPLDTFWRTKPNIEEEDAIFSSGAEVNLDSHVYWWHDKYRPRKPKYFSRVHTGYEWNKYNHTHYDHDNTPPKIVHGYKFNIFYPNLVDKIKAPNYVNDNDGNNSETCIIRFHAGPPYEDIAFQIVNKEWDYSHKKGFKCTFERVSHLGASWCMSAIIVFENIVMLSLILDTLKFMPILAGYRMRH